MNNYIPKSITYVYSNEETVDEYFEETEESFSEIEVYPTFPVETGKSLDTAMYWAGENAATVVTDNEPIKGIKVIGLDKRGNGGRAYKVLVDNKFYVDMREDVILEAMINVGIQEGGIINGEFVWGKYGSNMKLIRVGTSLHKQFVKSTERVDSFVEIKGKDTVPGTLYETKNGKRHLYLGKVYHYEYMFDWDHSSRWRDNRINGRLVKCTSHLYIEFRSYDNVNSKMSFDKLLSKLGDCAPIYINMKKSKSNFIKCLGEVDLKDVDFIEKIRDTTVKYHEDDKNPYPHNLLIPHLSMVTEGEPIVHSLFERFNLPITKK